MKNLLPLILVLLFTACNKDLPQNAALPELKNRPFVIGPEDEMGNVLSMYESLARQIEADPKNRRLG
ncbi:MAG: hypothetical protein IPG32_10460 [Saprospirales bacterium]|nr:hypothetical protein [Saprospirales bacterium]